MSISQAKVEADLRSLGLQMGDDVLVHSSYKSIIGGVCGGPSAVVAALLAVIGPSGTLVVPTFTHSGTTMFDPQLRCAQQLPWTCDACHGCVHPTSGDSPTKNGAICEAARAHPSAVRSWHPTHATTAIGPAAVELVRDDLERGPLVHSCPHRIVESRL